MHSVVMIAAAGSPRTAGAAGLSALTKAGKPPRDKFMTVNNPEPPNSGSSAVKSAARVLDLLELLAKHEGAASHATLADGLRIPKSSLTQLLKDLVARRYVEFVPEMRGYRIGPAVAALLQKGEGGLDILTIAQPLLRDITEQTGESSALNRLRDESAEVAATVSSPHRLVTHMRLGELAPLYATSGGKILLAHMSEAELEDYLATVRFDPVTPNTITTVEELRRQLAAAKQDGVAFSFEEYTPGIVGIAVPILRDDGRIVASFNVAMPTVRYSVRTRDLVIEVLRRAARKATRRITAQGS